MAAYMFRSPPRPIPARSGFLCGCRAAVCSTIVAAVVFAKPCAAAETQIESLRVGINGVFRPDRWCPVAASVVVGDGATAAEFDFVVVDRSGQRSRFAASVASTAGRSEVATTVWLGSTADAIVCEARGGQGEPIARREFALSALAEPLKPDEALKVIVGRLSGLDSIKSLRATQRSRIVQLSTLSLPAKAERAEDYFDAADAVVLLANQPSAVAEYGGRVEAMENVAWTALDHWVRNGGRAVLSLGPKSSNVLPWGSPWRKPTNVPPFALRQTAPLEAYIGMTDHSDAAPGTATSANVDDRDFQLSVTRIEPLAGRVVAAVGEGADAIPLIVQAPYGFGEVTVVAFDLNDEQLARWPGRARLLAKLFDVHGDAAVATATTAEDSESANAPWSGKAYRELDEQLADALDQFPGASADQFWWLVAAAIGYIAVIGPIDWYLVRRRPQWTWATFLSTVAIGGVLAYVVVSRVKGDAPRVNRLDVIDVLWQRDDPGDRSDVRNALQLAGIASMEPSTVRGSTWWSLHSADAANLRIRLARDGALSSQGPLSGELTAMTIAPFDRDGGRFHNSTLLAGDRRDDDGDNDPRLSKGGDAIAPLGIAAWSSRSLRLRWRAENPKLPPAPALTADSFGRTSGTLANPFDEPLLDAALLYGSFALPLGSLSPRQTREISARDDWRALEALLTHRRMSHDSETAEAYDPAETNLGRIIEIAGFYQAVGGKSYVKLGNRALAPLDLSRQLALGRAILVGKTASTGPAIAVETTLRDGRDDAPVAVEVNTTLTQWRFVIPVSKP